MISVALQQFGLAPWAPMAVTWCPTHQQFMSLGSVTPAVSLSVVGASSWACLVQCTTAVWLGAAVTSGLAWLRARRQLGLALRA